MQIYIDGVYQEAATYSVSGSTLTFTEAPPTNASIEVIKLQTTVLNTTTADLVTYTPAGTGAVDTTVQAKLRESVSAQDFGAVGDGVTDDTAAIQAALNAVRAIANANTEEIDVGVVKLKPNTIYKIGSDLTIPKRITLEAKGVKILLDADVSIISDQDAHFCADRNTQVIMATGHTTSAFKKNATTGGMHITGWPLIKSVDPAARTGASVGNIAVNMTRVKAGLIEVKVEECGTPIYIDAQAASDTCYYNEICLHARAFNYGIYSTGEYSNGNTFRIRRLSDGYRAINYIPGTSSIAGSGNNFYGGFSENITNIGVNLEDANQNNFYGMTCEGTGTPTAAINLAGASTDNKFFGVEAGDQFASSTKVIVQSSGTLRTTFIGSRWTNLIDVSGAISAVDATGSTINGSAVSGVFTNVTGTTTSVNVDTNDHVSINHSSATNFTDFAVTSNIRGPRLLYVYFASGNTTLKHATGNIRLSSGGDETPAAGDVYQFYRPGAPLSTNWFGKQLYP